MGVVVVASHQDHVDVFKAWVSNTDKNGQVLMDFRGMGASLLLERGLMQHVVESDQDLVDLQGVGASLLLEHGLTQHGRGRRIK
jgi:hypothetical protein